MSEYLECKVNAIPTSLNEAIEKGKEKRFAYLNDWNNWTDENKLAIVLPMVKIFSNTATLNTEIAKVVLDTGRSILEFQHQYSNAYDHIMVVFNGVNLDDLPMSMKSLQEEINQWLTENYYFN